MKQDAGMMAAVWVLIDFIEEVEFHSVSDYPAKLLFFAGGEVYEVIYVPLNQEALSISFGYRRRNSRPAALSLWICLSRSRASISRAAAVLHGFPRRKRDLFSKRSELRC